MKTFRFVFPLCMVMLFTACRDLTKGKGIEVQVSNQSGSLVSEVSVSTSEKLDSLVFPAIKNSNERSGRLSMKDNRTDGSYVLRFKRSDGNYHTLSCGYFTNGAPMDLAVSYIIDNDTVLVKLKPNY